MASWRQQALVEAPVEDVWGLISDWARYPDWNGDVIKVTGGRAKLERGSTTKGYLRRSVGQMIDNLRRALPGDHADAT
jgi:hypothetical protein